MHFDGTITLGNILNGVVSIGAIVAVYTRIVDRLARLETKVDALWNHYRAGES